MTEYIIMIYPCRKYNVLKAHLYYIIYYYIVCIIHQLATTLKEWDLLGMGFIRQQVNSLDILAVLGAGKLGQGSD